jgi:hypothetical protein
VPGPALPLQAGQNTTATEEGLLPQLLKSMNVVKNVAGKVFKLAVKRPGVNNVIGNYEQIECEKIMFSKSSSRLFSQPS